MATIAALYDEEGWPVNVRVLREPTRIAYYFVVFRDAHRRKLIGVRQATQFKGIVKSRLIRIVDDSLILIPDDVFKLDREFDFVITGEHIYILRPVGFERIAEIEEFVSARAQEKALALGDQVTFADFTSIAELVSRRKRAGRLVAALVSRAGLDQIERRKFVAAARETEVGLVTVNGKISPAEGAEIGFLELLDDRRYTTAIRAGPKEAYVASSRKQLR